MISTLKKILKNKYLAIGVVFLIYMSFFDVNSWFNIHSELNEELSNLERQKSFLTKEIAKDRKIIKDLETENHLESFARETYYFNTKDEDTYVIEYDTIGWFSSE